MPSSSGDTNVAKSITPPDPGVELSARVRMPELAGVDVSAKAALTGPAKTIANTAAVTRNIPPAILVIVRPSLSLALPSLE